uniref:Titin n=1 Tax=Steinernema glaseri TaxID=37863 RepID=A0A1I8A3Q6_9BILA
MGQPPARATRSARERIWSSGVHSTTHRSWNALRGGCHLVPVHSGASRRSVYARGMDPQRTCDSLFQQNPYVERFRRDLATHQALDHPGCGRVQFLFTESTASTVGRRVICRSIREISEIQTYIAKLCLELDLRKCIARNAKGEAQTVGKIVVESIVQIDAPEIVQALVDNIDNVHEGDSIHMECRVLPINDPKLQVQWLRNGAPLPEASRFKTNFEFGFVTLDILYAYPEDNGEYELVAFNDKGQASTKSHVSVLPKSALIFSPQAPGSRVDSIESHLRQYTRAPVALTESDAYDEKAGQPPAFKSNLLNIGVEEGDFCRFETQVAPIGDPYLKVEWFKDGRPVLIGNRIRSTLDFGFASLDLLYALPDDTGEYTCVATNRHGQTSIAAKLACSGSQGIITESQMPQGVLVADVKKNQDQLHWQEKMMEQSRVKQAPQFTIRPRNIQSVEGEPARFECAVLGNPKPKVTWYINGTQAIHGHRHKLNYDGIHYLTITHSKISDAGEVVAIAKNSEGETIASANLDVFQKKDFRQLKLKPAQFVTSEELQERQLQWQRETMGTLGEAFEQATKADVQKLVRVERSKSPIEPLETEELVQKFTRPKDDQFYDKLAYVEHARPQFEGLKLEEVPLKPGRIEKYQPPVETMESVQLKARAAKELQKAAEEKPTWASGERALAGDVEGRFKRLPEPEKEVIVPHRDTIRLKTAKPKRADELPPMDHVQIETEKAKIAPVRQGPEVPKEVNVPAKDQVQIKQKFQPVAKKPSEPVKIESGPMKQTPPVVKESFAESTISNKPQPTKIGQSKQAPPVFSQQLKPSQAQIGRSARFFCAFDGAQPINVKWFHNGKEIKPAFDTQIRTTNTGSTLDLTKLKDIHQGEYLCRIENVAGKCESSASLEVQAAVDRGVAPDFKTRMNDARAQQNSATTFTCVVGGTPKPVITCLQLDDVLPPDGGIYECVAKNAAGEARCKARLNIVLAKTGQGQEAGPRIEAPRFVAQIQPVGQEAGPRIEAPRFVAQIQPVVADEGKAAEFRAKYSGSPDPAIRWYRNNEPIKPGRNYDFGQANGEAWLKILQCYQEDVAEYKCDAVNPGGKATTVANLILKPKGGKIMMTTRASGSTSGTTQAAANGAPKTGGSKAPQFLSKLSSINARAGENVKLVAEIDGDPQPTVAWQFNGKPIYGGRDQKLSLVGNKAMLEIARVSQANAGTYIITIRNPSGAAQCEAKINLQSR